MNSSFSALAVCKRIWTGFENRFLFTYFLIFKFSFVLSQWIHKNLITKNPRTYLSEFARGPQS